MKTLSNYTEEGTTNILNKYGAFFAFGTQQFEEAKKEGVTYVTLFAGMVCPKENAKNLLDDLEKNYDDGILQDIAENGIEKIIKRELINYEAYYTGDIEDTVTNLKGYGITEEQVYEVYKKEHSKYSESW